MTTTRSAEVTGLGIDNPFAARRIITRYLPDNFEVADVRKIDGRLVVTVTGTDSHGWTLDGYVIPRLASGGYAAREVTA